MGTSAASMTTLARLVGVAARSSSGSLPSPSRMSCGTRSPRMALAAGVGTFPLARVMGTSLEMIERTYGHLVRGADDAFRSRLDAFAAGRDERAELAR